jgi:hypothetical protein
LAKMGGKLVNCRIYKAVLGKDVLYPLSLNGAGIIR